MGTEFHAGGNSETYSDAEVESLQLLWGEGYLSPGGPEAVARILAGLDISGKETLDLGCGLGGPAMDLIRTHGARSVVGVDVSEKNLRRAIASVAAAGLGAHIELQWVAPGRLPFPDARFDIVFSKDSLVEAPDKPFLFAEAFRLLRPGGWLAASDWLRADGPASPLLEQWIDFSGTQEGSAHAFHLASLSETRQALQDAGFGSIEIESENAWYRQEARRELARKTETLWDQYVALRGEEGALQSVAWQEAAIRVLDSGDFHPSIFRAQKPQTPA